VSELKTESSFRSGEVTEEAGLMHEPEGFPANEGEIGGSRALYDISIRRTRPKNPPSDVETGHNNVVAGSSLLRTPGCLGLAVRPWHAQGCILYLALLHLPFFFRFDVLV
jgi:hypothetical protein